MNYINKVCSFTGYRPDKLYACLSKGSLSIDQLQKVLKSELEKMLDSNFTNFQCGMAAGSDLLFAQTVLELKDEYRLPYIKLLAAVPCLEQEKSWKEADRIQYRNILERCDDVVLVSNSQYFDGCMAKRNRFLVDSCDELLAVYSGLPGGTMQTVNYAKKKMVKRVTIIDPSKSVKITLREAIDRQFAHTDTEPLF